MANPYWKNITKKRNITKTRKFYIYQTTIQSILLYGAEVWQIHTGEILLKREILLKTQILVKQKYC